MVTIHSDMTQEGSPKFSTVSFIVHPLTIPIHTSCSGNDLIEGLFPQIYAVMSGHVSLYPCCCYYGFNLSTVNSRKEICHLKS